MAPGEALPAMDTRRVRWTWLPRGGLPVDAWAKRHRVILWILWLHVPALTLFGLYGGYDRFITRAYFESFGVQTSLVEGGVIAFFAAVAAWPRVARRIRAVSASIGLVTCSAILTQFSGGFIEAHFHFFVVLGIIAMYLDWIPFLIAVGYVAVHHGTVGTFYASAVYNHPAATNAPWNWAFVHAFFVLGLSVALISHWRLSEDALARTESVLQAAQEAVVGLDPGGRVTFANAAATRLLAADEEALLMRPLATTAVFEPGGPLQTIRDGARRRERGTMRRADGTTLPVEWTSAPVAGGRTDLGVVVTLRDLRLEMRLEQERLRQHQTMRELEELRRQDEFKTRFINTAAHELNTPLTPVNIQLRLLRRSGLENLTPRQRDAIAILDRNLERFGRLVQDLLDSARLQGQRLGVHLQPTDLGSIVREAASTFDQAAREKGLLLDCDVSEAIPVKADPERLSQVLYNLLNNSLKFTPAGGSVSVHAKREDGVAVVTVQDTGIGLDQDQINRLFQPFSQVHSQQETRQGSGLGLYLSQSIVSLHGGRIVCRSDGPGRGARFVVEIPLATEGTGASGGDGGPPRSATDPAPDSPVPDSPVPDSPVPDSPVPESSAPEMPAPGAHAIDADPPPRDAHGAVDAASGASDRAGPDPTPVLPSAPPVPGTSGDAPP